jgi:catalase (peroxidase I)
MGIKPAGAHQWKPVGNAGAGTVPDAHDPQNTNLLCYHLIYH